MSESVSIASPEGKLLVLTPGLGAVATTFIAGVEAVRRGRARPYGSLTQLQTIRLGRRSAGRNPLIREFLPLAELDDLVFGAWDIFPDDAYEAAVRAQVLEERDLKPLEDFLRTIRPMPAVFDRQYVRRLDGPNVKKGPYQKRTGPNAARRHLPCYGRNRCAAGCDGLVRLYGSLHAALRLPSLD